MACGGQPPSEDGRRWLECQICLSPMVGRKPRALSCLHTFCESYLESLPLAASGITCPTCRGKTKLPAKKASSLPLNFMIEQLATKLHQVNLCQTCVENEGASNQAVVCCYDGCGHLCSDCSKRHNSVENFKEHQTEPLKKKDGTSAMHCVTHNKLIHLFCTKCKTCLCSTCALSSKHQGHESCIKEIRNEYQRLRSTIKERTKAIQDLCKQKLLTIKTQEEWVKKTSQEIENEYKRRRQKLKEERTKLMEKLQQIASPLTDFRSQIEGLREDSKLLEERIEFFKKEEKSPWKKMSEIILDESKCEHLQVQANGLKMPQILQHRFVASNWNTELGRLFCQAVTVPGVADKGSADANTAAWPQYYAQYQRYQQRAGRQPPQQQQQPWAPQQPQQQQLQQGYLPGPMINPHTGPLYYSLTWAEYYRQPGLYYHAHTLMAGGSNGQLPPCHGYQQHPGWVYQGSQPPQQ